MINAAHCPKCGFSDKWEPYAGELPNPDALRCHSTVATGGVCGYIYWRRNAPAGASSYASADNDWRDLQRQSMARQEMLARRARVRAIILAMIASPSAKFFMEGDPGHSLTLAERLDDAIEALTITQGRES
jgi:hypothetical protein